MMRRLTSVLKFQSLCTLALFVGGVSFAFVSQHGASTRIRRTTSRRETTERLRHTCEDLRICRTHLFATSGSGGDDWLAKITPPDAASEGAQLSTSSSSEQEQPPEDLGNIQIPSTGVSVTDEVEKAQRDKFESELVPITGLSGAAQIVTTANDGIIEPVRYLVSLSPPKRLASADKDDSNNKEEAKKEAHSAQSFIMVDIPPFSEKLLANMRKYMRQGGKLVAMVITSRDAIHYDDAPAVFTSRRSDLERWTAVFADAQVIGYRLDIPRDCRDFITQRLDGYGPWALDEESASGNATFVETGRPLTYEEWDEDVAKAVMDEGTTPPDDEIEDFDELYTPEAIRSREEGKRLLAVYTPGHTFGSLTYIFPEIQACCSGYTIPVEDDRYDESTGVGGGGPSLDFRGYITTNRAGMGRMMESARSVVDTYSDRFTTVLPSRGDPLFVDGSSDDRKEALNDIIDQYDKIGKVYEQLGITSPDEQSTL